MIDHPGFAGNLKTVSFARLLAFIARQGESGTLYLRRDKVDKAVQFAAGHPIYVASALARESFLRACVARGRMAVMAAIGLADQAIDRGRPPERIAQEQRLLSTENVNKLVDEIQIVRLMELFSWRKGDYYFDFDSSMPVAVHTSLDKRPLGELIQRGVRDHMDAGRIRAIYGERTEAAPRLVARPTKNSHGVTLKTSESEILGAIDGRRTVNQLVSGGTQSPKEAMKVLYFLDVLGCVRFSGEAPDVPKPPRADESEGYTFDVLEFSRQVDAEHGRMIEQNLFHLFSLERDFDEELLRRNYYGLAQRFRPEEHYAKATQPIREKADEIFESLSTAYEALLTWVRQRDGGRRAQFLAAWQRIAGQESVMIGAERDFLRGRDLMEQGALAAAREVMERCVQARPDEGEYWAYLGYLQFRTLPEGKGREQAIVNLKRAQSTDTNSVAAYRFLAEYFEAVGKLGSALEMMKRALRLRPTSSALRKAYRRLDRLAGGDAQVAGARNELREIERRLQEFVDSKRDANLYTVLGLEPDATVDDIRQAYFRAAKDFHPDRLANISTKLASHPMAEQVFQLINEAYEVLSDDDRRAAYDRGINLRNHEATIRQAMERKRIEELIRRGETAVREGNYEVAGDAFRTVGDLNPANAVAPAYLAYIEYVQDGSVRESLQSYEDRIRAAAADNPKSETVELVWGMLHKKAGNAGQALQHFQRAVTLNGNCVDALREIRLMNMRHSDRGGKESPRAGGVLGGLFGRKKG